MSKTWTKEEINYIKEHSNDMTAKEIAEVLGRTPSAVRKQRKIHGISINLPYSEADLEFIRAHFKKDMEAQEIADHLGRTRGSIYATARNLGLSDGDRWSNKDEEYLTKYYHKEHIADLAKRFNRTEDAVRAKAKKLELSMPPAPWSSEEDEYIRANYLKHDLMSMSEYLGRTVGAIRQRASIIGATENRRWEDQEVTYLLSTYGVMPAEYIASMLGCSTTRVYGKAASLGLSALKKWTSEDEDYLIRNYKTAPPLKIAQHLCRTPGSVKAKAHDLGLTINTEWSEEERAFLRENYIDMTNDEIARALGRTSSGVAIKAKKLGLAKCIKYHYDRSYFHDINTEEKAYWFGFICADGNVYDKIDFRNHTITIQLQAADHEHLRKFNRAIEGNIDVEFGEQICTFTGKTHRFCKIRCFSVCMCKDLIVHGCMPNKTAKITWPDFSDEWTWAFIRGYFDGNGCISTRGKNHMTANFSSGSHRMMVDFQSVLRKYGIVSYVYKDKNAECYRLYINAQKSIDTFLTLMYKDSTIYLDRKHDKAIDLHKKYNITQRLLRRSETSDFYDYYSKREKNLEP